MNYYLGTNLLDSLGFDNELKTDQIRWRFLSERFTFAPDSNEYNEFNRFVSSKEYLDMPLCHGNMPRLMLCGLECSPNEELVLIFKETDYAHTNFIWHSYYQRHKNIYDQNLINCIQSHYPNSFCLHLLVETDDDKLVQTTISTKKSNDYPDTICFTIGEQLELEDLKSDNFVCHWIKRALCEEFGIPEGKLEEIVDGNSFRVIGLFCEKDIFNYALLCVVRTKCSFTDFYNKVRRTIDNNEIGTVDYIDRDSIPNLLNHIENSNNYHPSTLMRLTIFDLHIQKYKKH